MPGSPHWSLSLRFPHQNPVHTFRLLKNNFHRAHTTGGPALSDHSQQYQCCTPYAVVRCIVLLMMGILMPETCWVE
jgi:hypothetical protein